MSTEQDRLVAVTNLSAGGIQLGESRTRSASSAQRSTENAQTPAAGMAPSMPKDAVLLLVDLQKAFDDPVWGPRNNPDLERNNQQLLELWRASGRPVIFVRHDSRSPNSTLRPGQRGNEIKDEVRPLKHEPVVAKGVNSAFIGTTLEADLHAKGFQTLVITGIKTDHCVSTTTRMAGNLGFETFVVSDATATFDTRGADGKSYTADEVSAVNLASLHNEFASVVDTATALKMAAVRQDGA